MIDIDVLCQWPISYLQDKLGGIITKNLVIIGGSSGFGKTTISRILTNSAIEQDCPVVLYSLEDVPDSFVTDAVRQEYVNDTGRFLDLQDFALEYKAHPNKFKKYQQVVYQKHHKTVKGLRVLQIHEQVANLNWNIDTLKQTMLKEIEQGYKLFILDHLDVLTTQNEYIDGTRAMEELWALVAEHDLALIAFSQLQGTRNKNSLCPSQDDLRGTNRKQYKATVVITIAKHPYGYYMLPPPEIKAMPTYMRVAKSRAKGTSCGIVYFNHGQYLDYYQEVSCNESGTMIDGLTQASLEKFAKQQREGK
ncbi:MAG: hypothetical protein J6R83_00505 [Clostridia bacterium]|nr:hypothetical protein [Clostridia bacterium]